MSRIQSMRKMSIRLSSCKQSCVVFNRTCHSSTEESFNHNNKNHAIRTIPNIITATRILAAPFLALAVIYEQKEIAVFGCLTAGFSDWLDGYIAKNYHQTSVLGAFLDPLADKVIIGALTLGLVYRDLLPIPLAVVIIGRDITLVVFSFLRRYRSMPKGAPFFDTTHTASFKVTPSNFSKYNTGCQFTVLSLTLCHFAFGYPSLHLIEPLWWITAVTTVGSGLAYIDGSGITEISGKCAK